jgi:hypothetical protein
MKVSYSKVSKYTTCPYQYKLFYIDKLKPAFDEKATNALHLGTCVHDALETRNIEHATKMYKEKYSIWDENNEIELLKLNTILPKVLTQIPEGEYEYKLDVEDDFIGYIDMLVKIEDGVYDLYDFKYATDAKRYESSPQVHLYKYYYEKITGNKIRNIYYAVIPKCKDTLDKMPKEKLINKIKTSYAAKDVQFIKVDYQPEKIIQFQTQKAALEKATSFEKVYTSKCEWCQLKKYCLSNGKDKSELEVEKPDIGELKFEEISLF